eukprot:scaffold4195_cov92-Isochrysis_galbana.AAC.3
MSGGRSDKCASRLAHPSKPRHTGGEGLTGASRLAHPSKPRHTGGGRGADYLAQIALYASVAMEAVHQGRRSLVRAWVKAILVLKGGRLQLYSKVEGYCVAQGRKAILVLKGMRLFLALHQAPDAAS